MPEDHLDGATTASVKQTNALLQDIRRILLAMKEPQVVGRTAPVYTDSPSPRRRRTKRT